MGNHRRYSIEEVQKVFFNKENVMLLKKDVICYARVSSHDQKMDLVRQKEKLINECRKRKIRPIIISEIGSGMNYKKKGLHKLLKKILLGQVDEIILTHKDRLLRFGSDLFFSICDFMNVKVSLIEEKMDKSFEEELVDDVLTIMTVFTSEIYGKRSALKRKSCA